MAKITNTGATLQVAAIPPSTVDAAGFGALQYTSVGEVIDMGEYGPSVQVVESNPLATGIVEKFKGFINYGSQTIGLEKDVEDAGQDILEAGVDGPTKNVRHSVKISYADGTVEFYAGKIFTFTTNAGSANQMVGASVMFEIETPVIRVLSSS